jgi:uncharacterized protein
MSATENKQLMQSVFAEFAKGNSQPFFDLMADNFSWTVIGTTKYSGTYSGKEAVMTELMMPIGIQFATQYKNTAHRFIAEDDLVVVECRGSVETKNGKSYNNTYCWVCRLADHKLIELTEYCDTELVKTALD